MLQQTQVATVIDYYQRFLKRFPDVQSLANANIETVLEYWSGLGYYRRARSMHQAAVQIMEQFGGQFPAEPEQIQSLHGIGRYTAGAIASFAYDSSAPILEANTVRLHARLLGIQKPVQSNEVQQQLWSFAESILPVRTGAGRVNQAVMEVGSLICTPQNPKCTQCPLRDHCRSHELGLENTIPLVAAKPKPIPMTHAGLIVFDKRQRILLRQNRAGQWWEGLWDLPWVELVQGKSPKPDALEFRNVEEQFATALRLDCHITQLHRIVRHAVTKFKIDYHCLRGTLVRNKGVPNDEVMEWFELDSLPAVSSRFRKIKLEDLT